jgi:hypothetical protein
VLDYGEDGLLAWRGYVELVQLECWLLGGVLKLVRGEGQ